MAFINVPGFFYTAPVDWHPDPVQVVHGGSPANGTYWHPSDGPEVGAEGSGLFVQTSHNRAAFIYRRVLGGPYPSDDPLCGFLQGASRGLSGDEDWAGTCPTVPTGTFIDSAAGANDDGSFWQITNSPRTGLGGGIQHVDGLADLTGWQLKPWELYNLYDRWMNDTALEDEWSAAIEATRPEGDGWFVDNEAARPFFVGMEFAPDEPGDTATSAGYDGSVSWLTDSTGWGYYNTAGTIAWFGNGNPGGDEVASYEGGSVDWQTVPDEWLPEQDTSNIFSVDWVVPADEDAATFVFTLAHAGIMFGDVTAGGEGTVTTAGRFNQTLAFRASWRVPQFRWAREANGIPPRRILQRSDAATYGAARVLGGGNTRQSGNRTLGGIL